MNLTVISNESNSNTDGRQCTENMALVSNIHIILLINNFLQCFIYLIRNNKFIKKLGRNVLF